LDVVLRVDDALGLAAGTWRLVVDATGTATVAPTDSAPDIVLGVAELSALYAGGVRATALAAAGLIAGDAAIMASLDDAFRTAEAPTLGIWY
ncbi:MAG: sterol carrier protein domain-containing protein, partial [Microbacterium sp.]